MESLQKLEFGTVVISIHEGNITQIETTEKLRFALEKKKAALPKQKMMTGAGIPVIAFPVVRATRMPAFGYPNAGFVYEYKDIEVCGNNVFKAAFRRSAACRISHFAAKDPEMS